MGVEPILVSWQIRIDVTEADQVQFFAIAATGSIDWEQHRPCYGAADQTDSHGHFEESEEEIGVEALVGHDVCIRDGPEFGYPAEQA